MKKLFQASTFFALLAGASFAQTEINVPFDFKIGESNMPAGRYSVAPVSNSGLGSQYTFRERNTGRTTMVSAPIPLSGPLNGQRRLVFNCANGCVLKEVWSNPSFGGARRDAGAGRGITLEGR
jgi:hypothetical protein